MSNKPENPPAFPSIIQKRNDLGFMESAPFTEGMTLRDYFAAKAMSAIIRNLSGIQPNDLPFMANDCYHVADAMLKAREEKQ